MQRVRSAADSPRQRLAESPGQTARARTLAFTRNSSREEWTGAAQRAGHSRVGVHSVVFVNGAAVVAIEVTHVRGSDRSRTKNAAHRSELLGWRRPTLPVLSCDRHGDGRSLRRRGASSPLRAARRCVRKLDASLPVSKRMRRWPYSTSAANPPIFLQCRRPSESVAENRDPCRWLGFDVKRRHDQRAGERECQATHVIIIGILTHQRRRVAPQADVIVAPFASPHAQFLARRARLDS
jgi:hypothetical protein